MKRTVIPCLLLVCVSMIPLSVSAKHPVSEILGIQLDMSQRDAHARLKKIGSLEREERKRQEVWLINDARFSHLLIGFDSESRVRYVTVIARTGGRRVRYGDVANLMTAQRAANQGNYKFTWEVPSRNGQPAYLVIAHGHDPQYLESYSLKKLDQEEID
jgi:hypothetical protein